MRWATPFFCGLLLLVAQSPLAHAAKRVALVIGNSAYERAVPLANPVHDAADISALLKGLGFEVIEGTDLKRSKMRETVRRFGDALEGADVGLFFYAGHGLQVAGENYLIPIDGELARERDLAFETVRLSLVLSQMERETKTNIVFLDACRDNPMVQTLARAMGTRSTAVGRGLARVESGVGTFIAFATQPGNVALDGKGRNSPFSAALIKHVATDGVDLSGIMIAVRNDVLASTAGKQVPWEHSSLTGQFFFKPAAVPAETPVAGSEGRAPSGEIALWTSVKDSDDPAMLQTYLDRFPTGTFSGLARLMRDRLSKEKSAKPEKTVVAAIASGTAASAGAPPGARFLTLRATLKAREGEPRKGQSYLGVHIAPVTVDWAKAFGLEEAKGAAVTSIIKGAPAEFAGLQPGDVIVKFDKIPVDNAEALPQLVSDLPAGTEVAVKIWRVGHGPADVLRWLRGRADDGDAAAIKSLAFAHARGFSGVGDATEAFRAYRRAAELDDAQAMHRLGLAYAGGQGVTKDLSESVRWYRKGAELGDVGSMTSLALAYAVGQGVTEDDAEAVRWYRKAGDLGDSWAKVQLGFSYEVGRGGLPKDDTEAVKFYREAADLGNSEGMTSLGVMLLNGKGVAKDEAEAAQVLRKAAELNNARAYYVLGIVMSQGLGVEKDEAEAVRLYGKSAELGNTDALVNLASMYERGEGVGKDQAEAVKLYRQAIDKGNRVATNNLASKYLHGRGVKKDLSQAAELYRKAVELGSTSAMTDLGWMHETGAGMRKDYAAAARLYRQAAELGNYDGMNNLGSMLANGRGVATDAEEAAQWVVRALESGSAFTLKQMKENSVAWGAPFRKALQRQLKAEGLYSGPIDGKFGRSTIGAIEALAQKG